jgi:hypothetical protein
VGVGLGGAQVANGEDRGQQLQHEVDALREAQGTGDQKLRQQIGDLTRTLQESRQATAHKEAAVQALHGDVATQVHPPHVACVVHHAPAIQLPFRVGRRGWLWGVRRAPEGRRKLARARGERTGRFGGIQVGRTKELEGQLMDAEDVRRKLHNMVQELRGNVRVFTRIRPGGETPTILPQVTPSPPIELKVNGNTVRSFSTHGQQSVRLTL